MMGVETMRDYSELRRELSKLKEECGLLIEDMIHPGKMVRGTLRWRRSSKQEKERKFPALSRTVGGKVSGRSVKLEDVKWLAPLLERHRSYRQETLRGRSLSACAAR